MIPPPKQFDTPPALRPPDWAGRTARGVLWTYLSLAGSRLVAFAGTVVLARLLLPEEFGQVGLALIVIGYLDTLGDFGAGSALIYHRNRVQDAAQVAFRISLLTGVLWWAAATALAPLAAGFFRDATVEPLLRTLAWVFPITALGNTHDALLRRQLSFGRRVIPDYVRALLKACCAIALVWQGWGVWSLVWGQLLGAAGSTVALWLLIPWRPALRAPLDLARPMLRYGSHIVSVNVLAAVTHHMDLLVVGRMLGTAALGFYTLAARIPEMCITLLLWAVSRVVFPTYANLQDDRAKLCQAFRTTLRYVSLVVLPMGVGLALAATHIVPMAYGERWLPAAPVLWALALAAAVRSLGSHAGDIFKATGRPDILAKMGLVRAAVLMPALVAGTPWGIAGVATAQAAVTAASAIATLFIAGRILGVPCRAWWSEMRPAVFGSAAMALVILAMQPLVAGWAPALRLLLLVGLGVASYAAALWLCSRETVLQAGREITAVLGRSA